MPWQLAPAEKWFRSKVHLHDQAGCGIGGLRQITARQIVAGTLILGTRIAP